MLTVKVSFRNFNSHFLRILVLAYFTSQLTWMDPAQQAPIQTLNVRNTISDGNGEYYWSPDARFVYQFYYDQIQVLDTFHGCGW